MSTPIKRKLATILSADVAGYSKLMEADEEGTLRLLAAHRAIIDSIIDLHDGRVVNTAGDSVLAEFTSPVEAVRAASEIQEALRTRNESLPERRRMVFRIGVNLGDVMLKGDDLLGDGVNVAARLQALAEPGGICISGSVFDQIEGKLSLRFQDAGEQALKNISRPVRALHLRGAAPKTPATTAAGTPAARPPRGRRGAATVAVVGAGVIVLAGGAYLAGFIPSGSRHAAEELAAWQAVETSTDVAALERYLAAHPAGAHAGDARAKVAALLASARRAAEDERGATERARAEAELARQKAEADTARFKAEADAAKARADAERRKAEEERAAARARADAAPARPRADPPRATTAVALPAAAPPATGDSRFDGIWVGEVTCPEWRGTPPVQRPQRAVVRNGEMIVDLPVPSRARTPSAESRPTQVVARIRDDDSVELRGSAVGPGGRTFERVFRGRFLDDRFTAQAEPPPRPCTLQLSRESGSARPGS